MAHSLWRHQTIVPSTEPPAQETTTQAISSGALIALVVGLIVLLWRRSRSDGRTSRRKVRITGWSELLHLCAGVVRGVLWLIAIAILLGRIEFWPSGRRW
jgi:hypothetical protein